MTGVGELEGIVLKTIKRYDELPDFSDRHFGSFVVESRAFGVVILALL